MKKENLIYILHILESVEKILPNLKINLKSIIENERTTS